MPGVTSSQAAQSSFPNIRGKRNWGEGGTSDSTYICAYVVELHGEVDDPVEICKVVEEPYRAWDRGGKIEDEVSDHDNITKYPLGSSS